MRLSESEIGALMLVAGSEKALRPGDLSQALNLRPESMSRVVTDLVNKGLLARVGKEIVLARTQAAESFKRLYFSHRASPLHLLLADRRADLLSRIDGGQKSVEALEKDTGIPKKTIYRYLKDFIRLGAVKRSKQGRTYLYSFNYILWQELKDFVTALLEYQALRLVPREALLIKGYGDSVLFKKKLRPDFRDFSHGR
jgi:predicted transcriptional regulator